MFTFFKRYPLVIIIDIMAVVAFCLKFGTDNQVELVLFVIELLLLNLVSLIDTIWGSKYEKAMQFLEKIASVLVLISLLVLLFL